MGHFLKKSHFFQDPHAGFLLEKNLVAEVFTDCESLQSLLENSLIFAAFAIKNESVVQGVICFGWVFDHFTDSLECDQLAKLVQVSSVDFWQLARAQPGPSLEKFKIYQSLLLTLSNTLTNQLVALSHLTEAARIKDELLAVVSHELKTPITSMLLRIQYLRRSKSDPGKSQNTKQTLEKNSRSLAA